MAILHVLQHLIVGQALEWKGAKCNYLVEQDSVAPDIRHRSKNTISQTLRGHPADRQHSSPTEPVVVTLKHGSRHPEVRELDCSAGVDKTVSAGNISMNISRTKL